MIVVPTILTACYATFVAWVREQELDPFHGRGVIAYGPYVHRRQIQVQAT